MSITIAVRFDERLYKRILQEDENKSVLIRRAVSQYFNDSVYNVDVLQAMKAHIADLQKDKEILQQDKHVLQARLDWYATPWYMRPLLPKKQLPE